MAHHLVSHTCCFHPSWSVAQWNVATRSPSGRFNNISHTPPSCAPRPSCAQLDALGHLRALGRLCLLEAPCLADALADAACDAAAASGLVRWADPWTRAPPTSLQDALTTALRASGPPAPLTQHSLRCMHLNGPRPSILSPEVCRALAGCVSYINECWLKRTPDPELGESLGPQDCVHLTPCCCWCCMRVACLRRNVILRCADNRPFRRRLVHLVTFFTTPFGPAP